MFTAKKCGNEITVTDESGVNKTSKIVQGNSYHIFDTYFVQCNENAEIIKAEKIRGKLPTQFCPWRGQPLEEISTIKIVWVENGELQTRTNKYIVHDCAMFGKCLPHYRCSPQALSETTSGDAVAVCKYCLKNPNYLETLGYAPT